MTAGKDLPTSRGMARPPLQRPRTPAESTVSVLFSFTRSYFHVDLAHVGEAVKFLTTILPKKRVSELFTVLGRAKQGKTERYRELFRHLQLSDDQFMLAPGDCSRSRSVVSKISTRPGSRAIGLPKRSDYE